MFYQTQTTHRPPKGLQKCHFCPWWPSPLTFDLDLQTHLCQGRNMSSVWIWCKSVQQFRRYFIHKKPQTDGAKNRTFRSSLRAVKGCLLIEFLPHSQCQSTECICSAKNNCCRLWFLQESILKTLQDSVEAEEEKNTQQLQSYETKLQSVNGITTTTNTRDELRNVSVTVMKWAQLAWRGRHSFAKCILYVILFRKMCSIMNCQSAWSQSWALAATLRQRNIRKYYDSFWGR